jgi:hypothetical protein
MDTQAVFEKYNQKFFIPRGASVAYAGTSSDSSKFYITDSGGGIQTHEFDPGLDEEEIGYMLEMLAQQL